MFQNVNIVIGCNMYSQELTVYDIEEKWIMRRTWHKAHYQKLNVKKS